MDEFDTKEKEPETFARSPLPAPVSDATEPHPNAEVPETNFIKQMQTSGFSADQIADWMNKKRPEAIAAGFTSQDVDDGIARIYREEQTPKAQPSLNYSQGELMMKALQDPYLKSHPAAMSGYMERLSQIFHGRRLMEADSASTYNVWMQDNLAEAANTGKVSRPIPAQDFVRYFGADKFQTYEKDLHAAQDSYRLAGMPPDERAKLINSYNPTPGAPGYAAGIARRNALITAADRITKEFAADRAGFTLRMSSAAQQDWERMNKAATDPTATPNDRQFFARKYAQTMIDEQKKMGADDSEVAILPNDAINNMVSHLMKTAGDEGAVNIVRGLKEQSKLWGTKYWPLVYRGVSEKAGPLFRVLGTGHVDDMPAARLAANANVGVDKILRDQDDENKRAVTNAVINAFKPFSRTIPDLTSSLKDDFISQGEKLAALYVSQNGMTATAAAAKAYKELVADAYDFSGGTYRVPKVYTGDDGIPHVLDPVAIANGTVVARDMIGTGKLALATKTNHRSGAFLSEAYLKENTPESLRAHGVWITDKDEKGLQLLQGDGWAARGPEGDPVTISWQELSELAKKYSGHFIPGNPLGAIAP